MTGNDALDRLFATAPAFEAGHVWLAGAGPGDPRLLTLDAVAALARADRVVHDSLVSPGVLALARPGAQLIHAGKRGGKPSAEQADITETLIRLAREGHRVLRLKGGDPSMFGRAGEEMLALAKADVPFRVIPGITAGLAALTAASIPVTQRGINQAVVFVTGHGAETSDGFDWGALARLRQPIVLYMAMKNIGAIAGHLMAGGLSGETPAAAISDATTAAQRLCVATLGTIEAALQNSDVKPPAIVVIGDIVAARAVLHDLVPDIVGAAP
jgi:uroporphyrin-III C-methyltransferase